MSWFPSNVAHERLRAALEVLLADAAGAIEAAVLRATKRLVFIPASLFQRVRPGGRVAPGSSSWPFSLMTPRLFRRSMSIRVFSRTVHVAGLVTLRQTFVCRRHRPTTSTSSAVPSCASRSWPHQVSRRPTSRVGKTEHRGVQVWDAPRHGFCLSPLETENASPRQALGGVGRSFLLMGVHAASMNKSLARMNKSPERVSRRGALGERLDSASTRSARSSGSERNCDGKR